MQIAPTKKDRNKKTKALNCLVNYNLKLMRESLLLSLIIERHNHGNHFIYQQQRRYKHKDYHITKKADHFTLI